MTSHSAILESTLNKKTRVVNIGDMSLLDPTTVIEAEDIPPNFNHAWNHINNHPNIANKTSKYKRGLFSTIFNFLFRPPESHMEKQLKKNVAILMENQNLEQSVPKAHAKALNIPTIHLANNRHMINSLVNDLKVQTPQYIIAKLKFKYQIMPATSF